MQRQYIKDNQIITQFINRMKSAENQYPTLTKEQEQELIEKYKDDEYKWRDLLVMHNLRLVFNNAKKYSLKTNSFDDMCQRGLMGLVVASRRFDPSLGYKFTTYANNWIFKYVVDEFYAKNINVDNNSVSLDDVYQPAKSSSKGSDNNAQTFSNFVEEYAEPTYVLQTVKPLADELSSIEESRIVDQIKYFVKTTDKIPETDKQIFTKFFMDKQKMKDISSDMNLPMNIVIEKKNAAVSQVKEWLNDTYHIYSLDDIIL